MKPNLIYVFADQLRLQSVGYAGDEKAQTPNLDRLCQCGVNVCNAVSGHPVCAPYRASLLTGKYTTSTGMVINEIRMNANHHTFADVLNESGYQTAYIGKWHMYAAEMGNHLDPKNSFVPPGRDRLGFNGCFAAYNFHHEYYGDAAYYHLDTPEKIYCKKYEPDEQTDLAIGQLESLAGSRQPFALFLSLGTPHDPWVRENVPAQYLERFKDTEFCLPENYLAVNDAHADGWACLSDKDRAKLTEWMRVYYAMTANLDDNVGRLMEAVQNLGLEQDTIFVFTSDHGEMFGAHGRRAKNIFYEEAVRVPFLVNWKGRIESQTTTDCCLNTVDIMPTLLTMMELPVPKEVEGRDYSGDLFGRPSKEEEGALMMCTGPTAAFGDGQEWRGYRTKQYTYAIYRCDKMEFLFDNLADPLQRNNLAAKPEYQAIVDDLRRRMHKEMDAIGDSFAANSYYEQNWIENRLIKRTATINGGQS